jgi:hypothetical protein
MQLTINKSWFINLVSACDQLLIRECLFQRRLLQESSSLCHPAGSAIHKSFGSRQVAAILKRKAEEQIGAAAKKHKPADGAGSGGQKRPGSLHRKSSEGHRERPVPLAIASGRTSDPPPSGAIVLHKEAPVGTDPKITLEELKKKTRDYVKEGSGGNVAEFARQVVRQARGVLISRGPQGGAEKPPAQRGGASHPGSKSYGPQALVLFDAHGGFSEPLAEGGRSVKTAEKVVKGGGVVAGGGVAVELGQELKRLLLVPPSRLEKKYLGCRLPGGGSDGRNEAGHSVKDKLRE